MKSNSTDLYNPKFSNEWESCILYNLAEWTNGLAFRKINFSDVGKPVIKIAELKNGITAQTKNTQQEFDRRYFLTKKDMVFSWSGSPETSIEVFWYNLPDGWLNQHIFKITVTDKIDNTFFYYLLKYLKPNFIAIAKNKQTTGLGHVTKSDLSSMLVRYPPIPEQKAIGSTLSVIDDKIELNSSLNSTLEELGESLFQRWFVDFEFPDEEGEPYRSSGGELVDSELGEIPKGWKTVENIFELCNTINYGYTQSASDNKVGPKFLRVTDINKGDWIDWASVPYCKIEDRNKSKYLLKKGDIVIARMADPGKVAIFESDLEAVFASYLIRIRLKDIRHAYYLYYLMKSKIYQDYILGAASGSVQKNLNAKGLTSGLSIVLPKKETIELFDNTIKNLRLKINHDISENELLADIRNSLLPKLMSGEIRVKVPKSVNS